MSPADYRGVVEFRQGSWERFAVVMAAGPGAVFAGGAWLRWRHSPHPLLAVALGLLLGMVIGIALGRMKRNRVDSVVITRHVVTGPARGSRLAVTIPLDNVDMVRTRDWSGALLAPLRIASHTGRTIHVSGLLFSLAARRSLLAALERDSTTRKYPPRLEPEASAGPPGEDFD